MQHTTLLRYKYFTTLRASDFRHGFSSYMPLFLAWVLSCLILSASFQTGQINEDIEVSQQSPLAQFNYAGKSYSLRFTGTKLENSDEQSDGPEAVVEPGLGIIVLTITLCLCFTYVAIRTRPHYRQPSRGPPLFLS